MSADPIIGLANAVTAVINAAVTSETLTTGGFTRGGHIRIGTTISKI